MYEPTYSTKKWSIDAKSWFRDIAINFIDRMRDPAFILEENGYRARILKIDKPGMVLYEDEYQAVSQNRTH